ncbi:MAG TPA: hypothetical protein PKE35_01575 [Anaerolineales bacterium]|nr:hypothetical protein [Anaerolineales bacterium]HMX18096.1 hypothetical protein [Anaerolineales bacterium]HMX72908.1 hypothetical protein [Anaerolineales bacterium]HNA56258.1 hypothetical protein [Anaerolineales bacterium]HNB85445.1 hypothetical protein [Anaerolineales bacterium]
MPESEADRLKRLRERQLRDRDPLERERKFQRNSAIKEKRMRKPISLQEDWGKVSYTIKMPIYALLLGGIGTVILTKVWISPYAVYAGAGITIVLLIFGVLVGNAVDLREDIKKHLK